MLSKGMVVKIYDGDLIGWTFGTLVEKYSNNISSFEKWKIQTLDNTNLVRFVKDIYKDFKQDGCGYILKEGFTVKAKVNFQTWNIDAFAESWDNPEYFRNIFLDSQDEVYEMEWDGTEFWEIKNVDDEREGTLFEMKDIVFQ
ncbi:hypothetical protein [Clostridium sp. HMP27]|uniref:hypothetical protein n=1 Tax=Clostridium sp. HMP27 TaxID=1487921 RepID=UPI000B334EB8|nr:hypothetical protein [Clostridium sp. HMP27]